jgi:hypothetical protein
MEGTIEHDGYDRAPTRPLTANGSSLWCTIRRSAIRSCRIGRRARRSLPARNADQATIRAARSLTRGLLENYYLPGQLEQSISEFVAYPNAG